MLVRPDTVCERLGARMANWVRVASGLLAILSATALPADARAINDPACQIILQWSGKPPVRRGPMVSLPGNPGKAIAYRDSKTGIFFYVESDGRHLAAINPGGKLLWVRDPFEDGGLCPYRNARPVIRSVRPYDVPAAFANNIAEVMRRRGANPSHPFIWIEFDSTQFGEVDQTTGDFLYEGQN